MTTFRSVLAGVVLSMSIISCVAAAPKDDFDICYRESGDEAIDACTRAIASGRYRGRDLAILYSNRGTEWYGKEYYQRAMRDHDEAIRIDRTYGAAYSNRGNVFSSLGERERAIEDYSEALRINPRDAKALNNRGDEYTLVGKYDLALKDLDAAIRIEPNPVRLSNRCFARAIVGQLDDAIDDCDRSLSMRKGSAVVYGRRGLAYLKLGKLDDALRDFDSALDISTRQALSLYGRGLIKLSRGETRDGNIDIEDAKSVRADIADDFVKYGVQTDKLTRTAAVPARPAPVAPPAAAPARPEPTAAMPARPAPAVAPPARPEPAIAMPAKPAPVVVTPATPSAVPMPVPPAPATIHDKTRRVALVIGNSGYSKISGLFNAKRDAEAVGRALQKIGFSDVSFEFDLGRNAFIAALRKFESKAEKADWAVIYFAGHGAELNGLNYLIPVDATLGTDRDLIDEAIALDRVLASVESAKKFRLIILDACRDNPFLIQMRRTVASRSVTRGLARIEPSQSGTLVAYAAKHGQVALDGDSANSPFVVALLKHLPTAKLEVNKLFRIVRDEVLTETNGRQEPFVYGSLPAEDFFFVPN